MTIGSLWILAVLVVTMVLMWALALRMRTRRAHAFATRPSRRRR